MPGCPKRQQSWGTVHHQALVSPVASDLMSSPLRKRIRSPDLRDALSAGLPGGEKGGLTGGKWDGRQTRAKFRPAVPALDPAPLCSGLSGWSRGGRARGAGTSQPELLGQGGDEGGLGNSASQHMCHSKAPLQTPCSAPLPQVLVTDPPVSLSPGENVSAGREAVLSLRLENAVY